MRAIAFIRPIDPSNPLTLKTPGGIRRRYMPKPGCSPFFDLTEFFKRSSVLNYNLSAATLNRYNVMVCILARKRLDADERMDREKKSLLMEALGYLFSAYSHKRRRLGPMAVLHPLRAAALMTRAQEEVSLVSLLTVLFHDILEGVQSVDFAAQEWKDMEQRFFDLLAHLEPEEELQLIRRLECLTRTKSESCYRLVTWPDGQRLLDGLFATYFAPTGGKVLNQQLDSLYQNKPLMIQGPIAFIVIFLRFLDDPSYYVRGISI